MPDDPNGLRRRSLRVPKYDYAQPGGYFVTLCTYERERLFGEVVEETTVLSEYGQIIQEEWKRTALVRPYVELDAFVVMPNHLHGIFMITAAGRGTAAPCPYTGAFGKPIAGSVPTIIRSFKSITTRRINDIRQTPATPVWQRNYYEHIIRNEQDLASIRDYIAANPVRWHLDRENPLRTDVDDREKPRL